MGVTLAIGLFVLAMLPLGVALASPGFGITPDNRAEGTLDGPFKVETDGFIEIKAKGDVRVFDQELVVAEGGHTGWHSHPGPVFVTVEQGTFRYQLADCSFTDFGPGQTFIDRGGDHVHIGINVGEGDVLLSVTYLVPAGGPLRVEAAAITCP
jgi:quercetin dioxygenase-like cupin family protein